jgi:putative chitinase
MAGIDWNGTQRRLGALVDGDPGRETFGKLIGLVDASGAPDATIERIAQSLAKNYATYFLTTPARIAEFIAEVAHETGGFMRFEENLNYSAQGLASTWPTRYAVDAHSVVKAPNAKAIALAHRPEAIANDTYALRMGNLDAAHDTDAHSDGWEYRGRGPTMLTGRSAYADAAKTTGLDLVTFPDLAADPFAGTLIALDFWRRRNINAAVDRGDFVGARKLVNGGTIGLDDVTAKRVALLKVLA